MIAGTRRRQPMLHRRTLPLLVGSVLLALPLVAQTAPRAEVVQVQAKKGAKITCPFETECDVVGVAFSVLNGSGTAIEGGGVTGVMGNGSDAGVAGFGDGAGVIGFAQTGPGVKAISKGETLFTACFNTIGFGCNNGNAV